MPPPNSLRTRRASAMNSMVLTSAEPIGAPRPLLKQTETLSKCRAHSAAGTPLATTAFHRRAPSRCMRSRCRRAHALLKAKDRRILAENVVPDFGGRHGGTHRRRRPGYGIAAQIDDRVRHLLAFFVIGVGLPAILQKPAAVVLAQKDPAVHTFLEM